MAQKNKSARRKSVARWLTADVKMLRREAGKKTPAQIARLLKRTPVAIQLKASKEGISLRQRTA